VDFFGFKHNRAGHSEVDEVATLTLNPRSGGLLVCCRPLFGLSLVWTKNEKRVIRVMEELASSKPDSVTEVDEVATLNPILRKSGSGCTTNPKLDFIIGFVGF
jgi:hypothetical protein